MRWKLWVVIAITQVWWAQASATCWSDAGARHAIEPELLYAIAQVESGLRPDAVNHNTNGSRDIGVMQINSLHFSRLQAKGITEQRLREEPCLAIDVGASILAEFVQRYGYNWTAVGAYNAGTSPARDALRRRYAHKVYTRYVVLMGQDTEFPQL